MSLIADYKRSLKLIEVEELLDLWIYRPLAYVMVKVIQPTPITPNQITIFSIFIGIAAGVCLGYGPRTAAVGAMLYAVSVIFDCADGQLARLKKNGTRMGRVLDGIVDYVTSVAVYVGVAVGLKPPAWPAATWWILMVAAAASNVFHSIAVDYHRTRYLNVVLDTVHGEDEDYRSFREEGGALRAAGRKPVRRWMIGVYLGYLDLQRRTAVPKSASGRDWRTKREEFRAANGTILRLWSLLGSSLQITLLVLAVLIGRISLYFWAMIVILNGWAAFLYIIQSRIDRRLDARISA